MRTGISLMPTALKNVRNAAAASTHCSGKSSIRRAIRKLRKVGRRRKKLSLRSMKKRLKSIRRMKLWRSSLIWRQQ